MTLLPRGIMANSKTIATMKRLFNIMMFVAVAAMGITACQNEPTEINVNAKKVTIEVIGELDATRSSFGDFVENGDADYYPSKWDGGEEVVFSLNEAALVTAENKGTGSKATFSVGLTDDKTTEGTIYAFSPKGNYDKSNTANCKGGFTSINASYDDLYVVVPTEQNPSTTSVDPAAHLLAGKATYDNGLPSSIKMTFEHAAAYGRMEITGFAEEITKVKITASEALAGTSCYYYYAGAQEGQLTNAKEKTITINNPAADNKVFWFGCAPADLSEGSLEVKVYTADASYTKKIDFASKDLERGFAFVQGGVSRFKVSITAANKDKALTIEDGQYVVAGKVGDVYYAMDGANQTTAATIASKEITVTDGKVAADDAAGYVWTVAAAEGGYTFFNGEHYLLASSSSGTKLETQVEPVVWALGETGDDGYIFISPMTNDRYLMFNGENSTNKFGAYDQDNYTKEKYSGIYLLPIDGVIKTRLPKPALTATVQNANEIFVSWGAITGAKDYTVTFNNGEPETVTSTEKTYTGLAYSAEYTITVVANPENEEQYIASVAVSAIVMTEADPDATQLIADGDYVIIATNAANSIQWALSAEANGTRLNSVDVTYAGEATFETPLTEIIWTIKYVGGKYTMSNGGKYINCKGGNDASTTDVATDVYINESDDETGRYNIVWGEDSKRLLSRNSTTANNYFAFYTGTQQDDLFIVRAEKITVEATTLPAPTGVEASNITESSATITWTAVANATGYSVTYNGTTTSVAKDICELTLTGLAANTDYSVTVVAKGDGGVYYNDSAASAVCEFKTLEAASGGDTTSGWVRVTSTDMILSGGTFIIGYEATAKSGQIVPMRSDATGAKTTANGYHYSGTSSGTTSNNSTIDMNTITDTSKYQVTITTSTTVSGAINIQLPNGNYIGANNSKNTARLYSSAGANTAYGVSIGANDVVTLKCAEAATYHTLQYNVSSPRFANYNGGQKNLVLYKLQ